MAASAAATLFSAPAQAVTLPPATFTTTVDVSVQGEGSELETKTAGGTVSGVIDAVQDAAARVASSDEFGSYYAVGRATTAVRGRKSVPETFANIQAEAGATLSAPAPRAPSLVNAEAAIRYYFAVTVAEPERLVPGERYLVPLVVSGLWEVSASAEGSEARALAIAQVSGPGGLAGGSAHAVVDRDTPFAVAGDTFRFDSSSAVCFATGCPGQISIGILTRVALLCSKGRTSFVSASATVDPTVVIDPDYEYAFAVQLSENIVQSVSADDGSGGGASVVPLPAPALLLFAALGSLALLWQRA